MGRTESQHVSSLIAPSLCALFNKSFRCGVLPDDWKLGNVVPVHKRGDESYIENYTVQSRFFSLTPKFSSVAFSITSNIVFINKSTLVNTGFSTKVMPNTTD